MASKHLFFIAFAAFLYKSNVLHAAYEENVYSHLVDEDRDDGSAQSTHGIHNNINGGPYNNDNIKRSRKFIVAAVVIGTGIYYLTKRFWKNTPEKPQLNPEIPKINPNNKPLPQYDNNNIFAKILRGEAPTRKVYEDANSLAFYSNSQPENQVRILIIPKKPYISFDDFYQRASKEEIGSFFQTIGTIAQPFKDSGYTLQANHGAHSGQTVFHFHVHLNAPKPENYQYKA